MRFRPYAGLCSTYGHKNYLNFIVSFILSLTVCLYFRSNQININHVDAVCSREKDTPSVQRNTDLDQSFESLVPLIERLRHSKGKLFIGVMTAQKYIDDRIYHIMKTWGQDAKDSIAFFSSSSTKNKHDLPMINLPTVDDSYPPQKKSFLMLKFIHDHLIDHYEWFMRADDDIFINVPKLVQFLEKVNSSKPQLIGQMGLGKVEEVGQLGLEGDDNFCMGGPGIIMSRETLKKMIPNIQYCLKHLYSTHEDVEISRCINKFVGVSCTRSYQMQSLLYQNYTGEIVWSNRLKKILKTALTLHPVKNHLTLYDIYYYKLEIDHENIRNEMVHRHREIRQIETVFGDLIDKEFNLPLDALIHGNSSLIGTPVVLISNEETERRKCVDRSDLFSWEFVDRYQYTPKNLNPRRRMDGTLVSALESNLINIVNSINKASHLRGRIVDFKSLYYGYTKVDPLKGTYYILDLLMTYRRYKGRKLTLPVRKHTYIMQSFSNPIFREIIYDFQAQRKIVNFIVPLSGRFQQFNRFMNDFIDVYKMDSSINLAIILFPDAITSLNVSIQTKNIITNLIRVGLPIRFTELGGHFSRAAGLQRGASLFKPNDLLFFIDIDLTFDLKVVQNVRRNTIQGNQVYYPIVYSQYSNQFNLNASTAELNTGSNIDGPIKVDSDHGYWRQFGFGIVSIYNSDLTANNGLNLAIQGWGGEDVDLYERIVKSNLTVFRAPDKGLIHIYHKTQCNTGLHPTQYEMCLGSKYSNLASIKSMTQFIESNKLL